MGTGVDLFYEEKNSTPVPLALHAFQKKSTQGIKTPPLDVRLIGERLKRAQSDYESTQ